MNKSAQIVHIHKADKVGVMGSIVRKLESEYLWNI